MMERSAPVFPNRRLGMGVSSEVSLAFAKGSKSFLTPPVRLPPQFLSSENLVAAYGSSSQEKIYKFQKLLPGRGVVDAADGSTRVYTETCR